jgi:NAD(P)-dependent dehydrogenase (short-subunit alcohol dehydrogenase family)
VSASSERRLAVITGAGGGVGLACARRFAPTHSLLLAEARPEALQRAMTLLEGERADVSGAVCDVSDASAVGELAERAAALGEPLGALVHTAALSRSMEDGPRIIAVNLLGAALVLRAFLPLAGAGSVAVCLSSIGAHREPIHALDGLLVDPLEDGFLERLERRIALRGSSGLAYDLSKRGVILLCERAAAEWGARRARVVSLSPGPIDTPMGQLEGKADAAGLERLSAFGRVAEADEVAGAVALMCSEQAGYVTGCDLRVDGGTLAGIRFHSSPEVLDSWNTLRSGPGPGSSGT